jgi:hypothetical protein
MAQRARSVASGDFADWGWAQAAADSDLAMAAADSAVDFDWATTLADSDFAAALAPAAGRARL